MQCLAKHALPLGPGSLGCKDETWGKEDTAEAPTSDIQAFMWSRHRHINIWTCLQSVWKALKDICNSPKERLLPEAKYYFLISLSVLEQHTLAACPDYSDWAPVKKNIFVAGWGEGWWYTNTLVGKQLKHGSCNVMTKAHYRTPMSLNESAGTAKHLPFGQPDLLYQKWEMFLAFHLQLGRLPRLWPVWWTCSELQGALKF